MAGIPWETLIGITLAVMAIVGAIVGTQRFNERGRSRIYERLDECKIATAKDLRMDYQRKDICAITHAQIDKRLDAIEKQTSLLPDIAAQIKFLVNGNKS